MFPDSGLLVLLGCLCNIVQAQFNCSCGTSGGCMTQNRCEPNLACIKENVALGKPTYMSSYYTAPNGEQKSGPSCLAVNGNRSHALVLTPKGQNFGSGINCVHTEENQNVPLWSVDLGANFTVTNITIYNRGDCCMDRLNGAELQVDGHPCFTIQKADNLMIINITCQQPVRGRNVTLKKGSGMLNFCELEVWVCIAGRYGPTCDAQCTCKDNETCDNYFGTCLNGCRDGFYGDSCSRTCGYCKNITCVQETGVCPTGCEAGWQGPLCNISCSPGFYGPDCNKTCGQCTARNSPCNITTGVCQGGCQAGYGTLFCNETCSPGFYGPDCNKTCGQCTAGNSQCNITTGVCQGGCQAGYGTLFCNETCSPGFYGPDCNKTCGQCTARNSPCNITTGVCQGGCQAGYGTLFCNETCSPGLYGPDCNKTCGQCTAGNSHCNITTGVCQGGCQAGYGTLFCNETCSPGFYGPDCNKTCGQCTAGNSHCNITTGLCQGGCQAGYGTLFCNETCIPGLYGPDCNKTCGQCTAGNSHCIITTGVCQAGCQAGYITLLCNETCTKGYHGDKCNLTCGHCAESDECHHETGVCLSGCESGYQGPLCDVLKGSDEAINAAVAGGVSAAVVLSLSLTSVVVFAVIRYKRRSARKPETLHAPDTRANTKQNDYTSPSSSRAADQEETRNKPSAHVQPILKTSETRAKLVTSQAHDHIYINVTIPSALAAPVSADGSSSLAGHLAGYEPTEYGDQDDSVYFNDRVYATFKASSPQLDGVQRSLVDIMASDKLPEQFKKLPKGLTDSHQEGKLEANIKKNRYTSVLPYDHNRVILKDGYSEGTATDYINASYISGFQHEKKYIATQGPRDFTMVDLWRMVWQEEITRIIMLTKTAEAGQNKCSEYWPAKDRTATYGSVSVSGVDVQPRADFIVRTFRLKKQGGREEREVEQYHYLAWPDHGTPTTTSLLNFWRFARARAPHSPPPPVLVHCTAGVGRTGTYIGLDIAFDEAVAKGEADVLRVVTRLRKERCIMVQTLAQFVFLHKSLLEAYTGRDTTFPLNRFERSFPDPVSARRQSPRIDEEFQRIMQMRSLTPEMTYKGARGKENIEKNRNPSTLPSDEHRVYLTAHVPGRNQYINAVYMSEYLTRRCRILTQLPLPSTLVDFWRLVHGNNVTTIVSLGSVTEAKGKDFCQYWPVDGRTSVQAHPYAVKLTNSSRLGSHLTSYKLSVEAKGSESRLEVCLVRFEGWAEEIPANISELLFLINFLDARRQCEANSCPVVIQCLDGVTKSGLFGALCDVISRLTHDKEIDVYMAIRELHNVTPQAVTSVLQYRYCYEVAQLRHSEMNLYANIS